MLKNLIEEEFTDEVKPFKGVDELSTPLLAAGSNSPFLNELSPAAVKLRRAVSHGAVIQ